MSATGRGGERIALDAYYTPDDVAARCVAALPDFAEARPRVLEPSVGGGAFVRAVVSRWPLAVLTACDVDGRAEGFADIPVGRTWVRDFVHVPADISGRFDLIVGNPPYSHAEAHIRHALSLVDRGGYVAFLLRLAMLESVRRRPLWDESPLRSVHVLSARPSFTGGGTDSAAYGWFVWQRGYVGDPTLGWL